MTSPAVLQLGIPELIPQVVGIAGTIVLALMVVAIVAFAYKSFTGGVEWPEEDEDEQGLRQGGQDDEWDYY